MSSAFAIRYLRKEQVNTLMQKLELISKYRTPVSVVTPLIVSSSVNPELLGIQATNEDAEFLLIALFDCCPDISPMERIISISGDVSFNFSVDACLLINELDKLVGGLGKNASEFGGVHVIVRSWRAYNSLIAILVHFGFRYSETIVR